MDITTSLLLDVLDAAVKVIEQDRPVDAAVMLRDAAVRVRLATDVTRELGGNELLQRTVDSIDKLNAHLRTFDATSLAKLMEENQQLRGALAESGVQLAHFARANDALANERDALRAELLLYTRADEKRG